jgi:hypothetical protein
VYRALKIGKNGINKNQTNKQTIEYDNGVLYGQQCLIQMYVLCTVGQHVFAPLFVWASAASHGCTTACWLTVPYLPPCLHGRQRQATDVLLPAGLLYRICRLCVMVLWVEMMYVFLVWCHLTCNFQLSCTACVDSAFCIQIDSHNNSLTFYIEKTT